ncbi:hypothetical protein CEUSTIGMA_g8739.t1 [Chlamydomonas eustigma]|uniref:Nephrocystin 3-like N-terminal domain-containing protein n=1 Tax=Chlamydomonas eustigma TaxID=1157962 RepID=A0A250XE01_9CHLO|nr:hypothetical protein CEUSTIGMA_g8739.t1 [Chlamydomonas eustigma]|eukprot:GAX81308.1 hypothetical protein CEUSTIGMA_g8739.t1 [Chlamydomonas eustigma]
MGCGASAARSYEEDYGQSSQLAVVRRAEQDGDAFWPIMVSTCFMWQHGYGKVSPFQLLHTKASRYEASASSGTDVNSCAKTGGSKRIRWIKDPDVSGDCRLADVPTVIDPDDVGPPTYFVSHAWLGTVCKLFDTITSFLSSASDETCIWIDCIAINQHGDTNPEQNQADVAAFEDVLQLCSGGTIVVVDMANGCNPASRAWCLYEWDYTLHYHGPDGLHLKGMDISDLAKVAEVVNLLDVEKASCQYEYDTRMILGNIRNHHGSTAKFNTALKLQLMLSPLSYKVDLGQRGRRSAGTTWHWGDVETWLEGFNGSGDMSRALCVLAGAGTGKSTISAAIWEQIFIESSDVAGAIHFLKHSDQRRLEPVKIIKSLAFQLAAKLPHLEAALLKLSPVDVAALTTMEAAFNMLLRPLELPSEPPRKIVIMVDALDEGDPLEQQQSGFTGGIMAGGNKALNLIVTCFSELPHNIRFIFSSRPDAACNHMQAILQRAFEAKEDGGPGGVTFIEPHHELMMMTQWMVGSAVRVGSMGRIMVFDTVVKECDLLEDEELVQGMLRESVLQGDPLLAVYGAYRAVFDMKPPSGVAKNLLQVLIAAQEPLSHSMLQLLGLSNHLESLPGWSCLLYIADHHIYMLHTSLSEWMVDASKSGPHAVDVTAGHRLMGMHLVLREVLSLGATSPAAADGRKLFRRTSVGGVEGGLERTLSKRSAWLSRGDVRGSVKRSAKVQFGEELHGSTPKRFTPGRGSTLNHISEDVDVSTNGCLRTSKIQINQADAPVRLSGSYKAFLQPLGEEAVNALKRASSRWIPQTSLQEGGKSVPSGKSWAGGKTFVFGKSFAGVKPSLSFKSIARAKMTPDNKSEHAEVMKRPTHADL